MADPFSIATGVIALIGAVSKISIELRSFCQGSESAGSVISSLLTELDTFQDILQATKTTLETEQNRPRNNTTGHLGTHWRNLLRCIKEGPRTISKLTRLLENINRQTSVLDASRRYMRLKSASQQIESFRHQIQSYKDTMQLSMQTIVIWNQATLQESTDEILPNLYEVHQAIKRLALDVNSCFDSLRTMEPTDDNLDQLRSVSAIRETVRSAAVLVSSASIILASDDSDESSIISDSDIQALFPQPLSEAMRRWMDSNTICEFGEDGVENPVGLYDRRQDNDNLPCGDEEVDSDSDLESDLVNALFRQGQAKLISGDSASAERLLRNCLSRMDSLTSDVTLSSQRIWGKELVLKVDVLNSLFHACYSQNDWEKSQAVLRDKISIKQRLVGPDDPDVIEDTALLVQVLLKGANYSEARLYGRQILRHYRKLGDEGSTGALNTLELLIKACQGDGDVDEEDAYTAMVDFIHKRKSKVSKKTGSNLTDQAQQQASSAIESRKIQYQRSSSQPATFKESETPEPQVQLPQPGPSQEEAGEEAKIPVTQAATGKPVWPRVMSEEADPPLLLSPAVDKPIVVASGFSLPAEASGSITDDRDLRSLKKDRRRPSGDLLLTHHSQQVLRKETLHDKHSHQKPYSDAALKQYDKNHQDIPRPTAPEIAEMKFTNDTKVKIEDSSRPRAHTSASASSKIDSSGKVEADGKSQNSAGGPGQVMYGTPQRQANQLPPERERSKFDRPLSTSVGASSSLLISSAHSNSTQSSDASRSPEAVARVMRAVATQRFGLDQTQAGYGSCTGPSKEASNSKSSEDGAQELKWSSSERKALKRHVEQTALQQRLVNPKSSQLIMFMFQSHFIEMQIPSNITLGALENGFRTLFQIKQRIVVTAYAHGHDCIQTVEISTDAALKRFLTANDSDFLISGLLYITTNEWHCVNPSPILIRADPRLSVWTGVKDNIPAAIATQCRGFSGKPSITGTVNIVGDSRSRRDIVDLLRHSLKDVVPMVYDRNEEQDWCIDVSVGNTHATKLQICVSETRYLPRSLLSSRYHVSPPGPDCIILCFSICDRASYDYIVTKYLPALEQCHEPALVPPIILIGTRQPPSDTEASFVSYEEALTLKKKIDTNKYFQRASTSPSSSAEANHILSTVSLEVLAHARMRLEMRKRFKWWEWQFMRFVDHFVDAT